MNIWIWAGVAILYLIFSLWYFNWKGPLTTEEIDGFTEAIASSESPTDPEVIRKFLEEDDGKEFIMLNLVRFHDGQVEHPETGEKMSGAELVQDYFGPFSKALFKRGGHPVLMSRKKGGYIDSWNTSDDEGFQAIGTMRYRSRRDLMLLVSDPRFGDSHKYKLAAIDGTISFPMQSFMSTYFKPQVWVALLLILMASLAQNALFFFELRK